MKHFEVDFENADGDRRVFSAELPDDVIAKAGGEMLYRDAYVLQKIYHAGVPVSFRHVPRTVRELRVQ